MRYAALAPLVFMATLFAGCGDDPAAPQGAAVCDDVERAGLDILNEAHTVVALATSEGCIVAELQDDKAPITVANFLNYTNEGFYSGMLFQRVIKDFMVQTGGMTKDGEFKQPTHGPIVNEARTSGLRNLAYTLSMARGNAANSATNQFFVNHADNAFLDPSGSSAGYSQFGTVISGRGVVDAIANKPVQMYKAGTKCQAGDQQPSCPLEEIDLFSVRVVS